MKFGRNVLPANVDRLTESEFWYDVTLPRWRPRRPPAAYCYICSVRRLPASPPTACCHWLAVYATVPETQYFHTLSVSNVYTISMTFAFVTERSPDRMLGQLGNVGRCVLGSPEWAERKHYFLFISTDKHHAYCDESF